MKSVIVKVTNKGCNGVAESITALDVARALWNHNWHYCKVVPYKPRKRVCSRACRHWGTRFREIYCNNCIRQIMLNDHFQKKARTHEHKSYSV